MKFENYESLVDWLRSIEKYLAMATNLGTSSSFAQFCGIFDIAMQFGMSLDKFCEICRTAGFSPELIYDTVGMATQKRIENHFKEKNNDNIK